MPPHVVKSKRTYHHGTTNSAGVCIGSVIPFTLIVIYPTNRQLEDLTLDLGSLSTATSPDRWNRLHAVRSGAAIIALVILLMHLGGYL